MTPHEEKYDRLAHMLGVEALVKLVPFTRERVQQALAQGDEHLNTLSLATWDRQHGYAPDECKPKECPCCKQWVPSTAQRDAGVWGLVRKYVREHHTSMAWSQADTVCVLKHVAKFYL